MENEISSEQPKQLSYEEIIKEGESIYPMLDEEEKKSFESNKINNWLDIFYNLKKRNLFKNLMNSRQNLNIKNFLKG